MSSDVQDLFGAVDLPDGVDALALWDAAVTGLRDGLTGDGFGAREVPALLLASVPEPLFRAWAAWRGVQPEATADGLPGFALDGTVHVAAQSERDRGFLGPGVLFMTGVDGDGTWCPRGLSVPVAEVLARHLRATATRVAAAA